MLVVTGDGEMLMGLGGLATIGVQRPPNLAIAVFDNGHYGETGMQPSHTEAGVELVGVARACGIKETFDVSDEMGLREFAGRVHKSATTCSPASRSAPTSRRGSCRRATGFISKTASAARSGSSSPGYASAGGSAGIKSVAAKSLPMNSNGAPSVLARA